MRGPNTLMFDIIPEKWKENSSKESTYCWQSHRYVH